MKQGIGIALACLLLASLWGYASLVLAQGNSWQTPINISNSPVNSLCPSIAVDPAGGAHVVWFEKDEEREPGTAIYYARYNGETWSPPVDIVIPPQDRQIVQCPVLAADQLGNLHIVFVGRFNDQVFYSQAYAPAAGSAKAWDAPRPIGNPVPNTTWPDLSVDRGGTLHVVYTIQVGDRSGVYYSRAFDNGQSWRMPSAVFVNEQSDRMVDHARLAVDAAGGIHVIWTEYDFPDTFPPLGIRYSHSTDGGHTWSKPLLIDGPYDYSGITTVGHDQVHIVWSGTKPDRHKFHRWSADRGVTWSPTVRTLELGGFQRWPGLASDNTGQVHLLQSNGILNYQIWRGNGWSPPDELFGIPERYPPDLYKFQASSSSDIAVGLGNELHVVAEYVTEHSPGEWSYDIYYRFSLTDAPRLEPQALPTPTAVPSPTPTVEQISTAKATEITPPTVAATLRPGRSLTQAQVSPTSSMFLGVLPALMLVGGVIAVHLLRRDSR